MGEIPGDENFDTVDGSNRNVKGVFRIIRGYPPACQVESPEPLFDRDTAEAFLARESFPVTRRRPKKADRVIDLRELVAKLRVADPRHLELNLRLREKDNVKVTDALAHIFNLNEDQARDLQILKLRSL